MKKIFECVLVALFICSFEFAALANSEADDSAFDADKIEAEIEELRSAGNFEGALERSNAMLATAQSQFGPDSIEVGHAMRWVGTIHRELEQFEQAKSKLIEALQIYLDKSGSRSSDTAIVKNELGIMYERMGNYEKSFELGQEVLDIRFEIYGERHHLTAQSVNNLGVTHYYLGNFALAEQMFLRSIDIKEEVLEDPESFEITESINNLAAVYDKQGRHEDAEPLLRRILEVDLRQLGADHPYVGTDSNNLADTLINLGRHDQAIPHAKEAIRIFLKKYGKTHRFVADSYNSLGLAYARQGSFGEAMQNYIEAQRLYAKLFGEDSLFVSRTYNNIGELLRKQGEAKAALPELNRALSIRSRILGRTHRDVADVLSNIGHAYLDLGDYRQSLDYFWRAILVLQALSDRTQLVLASTGAASDRVELATSRKTISGYLRAAWALYSSSSTPDAEKRELFFSSFKVMQWAELSRAAHSISQMAARFAAQTGSLGDLLREHQDLASRLQRIDRQLAKSRQLSSADRDRLFEQQLRAERQLVLSALKASGNKIEVQFEDFSNLTAVRPLGQDIRRFLDDDEVVVAILAPSGPEETVFVWTITDDATRWVRTEISAAELNDRVRALRCGLSLEEWDGIASAERCFRLLRVKRKPSVTDILPFDLKISHSLYRDLLAPVEDLIQEKSIYLAPTGPLTSIPFHTLVMRAPKEAQPRAYADYANVAWLGAQSPITTLPSVGSLKALRDRLTLSNASMAYLGYGDPVLNGNPACGFLNVPEQCSFDTAESAATVTLKRTPRSTRQANVDRLFRAGTGVQGLSDAVRSLCPLPDTAYELKCIAERFDNADYELRLAEEATEQHIKARTDLDQYRIVHFATHGLLAGDADLMFRRQGEPALVMTPPEGADTSDDGLLTASEIAQLDFDADLIILSACNTAGGDELGAEALSGLARAFFYAGGRSMLVSHWPVFSDAAVSLMTQVVEEMRKTGDVGVAEALRRAMVTLMQSGSFDDNPHPSVWAAFVVVGEGATQIR